MGGYISTERCQAVYNITPICSVPGAQPISLDVSSVGNIQNGQFEGNEAISGIGGLIGFFATSWLACVSCLIGGIVSTMWFVQPDKFGGWKSEITVRSFKDFVFSCSDLQLLTGLAYCISLRFELGCNVSAYHYIIMQDTILAVAVTQFLASMVIASAGSEKRLETKPGNKWWASTLLRTLGILPFWILSIISFQSMPRTSDSSGLKISDGLFSGGTEDASSFLPVLCFTTDGSTRGTQMIWTCLAVWGCTMLAAVFRGCQEVNDSSQSRSAHREAVSTFPGGIIFSILSFAVMVVLGLLSYNVADQKNWVKNSGWVKLKDGRNTEEYVGTLGQLIALCQFPISILGCAKAGWKVYTKIREEAEKSTPSSQNGESSSAFHLEPYPSQRSLPTNQFSDVAPTNPTSMLDT